MRTKNSLLNIGTGIFGQLLSLMLAFIARTIFIKYLGSEYLGISGLFTNIISLLSITELGFGSVIVFAMYKPIAFNETSKLQALMNLYKRIYRIMGLVVLTLGLILLPFLPYLIKSETSLKVNFYLVFLIYLMNSVFSYLFFAYRSSIITAHQKQFLLKPYEYVFNILAFLGQVFVIIRYKSFLMYLIINLSKNICINLISSKKASRLFPEVFLKNNEELTNVEKMKIWKDTFALSIYRISGVIVTSTDNIIISVLIGIKTLGVFSNYIYITSTVNLLLGTVFSSMVSSVGNLGVSENTENKYQIFKNIQFINYWMYGLCFICLIFLMSPFINLWIGERYLLPTLTVSLLSIQFLIIGFENTTYLFRTGFGLFSQARFRPVADITINLIVSIVLATKIGINGVILGTIISRLLTYFWVEPIVIYKNIFKKCSKEFFKLYLEFCIVLLFVILILLSSFQLISGNTILAFVLKLFLCLLVYNSVVIFYYHKRSEFGYVTTIVKRLFSMLKV